MGALSYTILRSHSVYISRILPPATAYPGPVWLLRDLLPLHLFLVDSFKFQTLRNYFPS